MTAGLAEREIAEFVDDDEIIAQQILGEPPAAAGGFLLFELIDEIDQIEETTRFIRSRAKRWRRAVGASCTEAWSTLRSVSLTTCNGKNFSARRRGAFSSWLSHCLA